MLTRYTDVLAELRDHSLSSDQISAFSELIPESAAEKVQQMIDLISGMALMSDPPDHIRLRKVASKAFTSRVIDRMRSYIENVVEQLLAGT